MSIKAWNLLLVFGLLAFLAAGGGILYQNHVSTQAQRIQAEIEAREEAVAKAVALQALKQDFENALNGVLRKLYAEMQDYKKRRTVLFELAKPENFAGISYIEENAGLAESAVLALNLQMETVMAAFEAADQDITALIARFEEGDARTSVVQRWQSVRDENVKKFALFFAADQELFEAYLALMSFYNQNRDVVRVDPVQGRVVFEDGALQEQEALLRGRILELKSRK